MSSHFKNAQFNAPREAAIPQVKDTAVAEPRVVKVENQQTPVVRDFSLEPLKEAKKTDYAAIRKGFASTGTASAVPAKNGIKQKDSRFSIHQLARGPLSIEDEEKRVIEERVRARVGAVAEEAKARAADVGYQDGLKRGHEEAYRRFQAEGAERLAKLEGLLQSFERAKTEIFHANERFLVELVYRIGRMVLLRELTADRDYVLRVARDLIERVGIRENIKVRISPADAESIGMLKEGLEKSLGELKNLNIEVSKDMPYGGCRVETEWNAIDASIQTQLESMRETLVGPPAPNEVPPVPVPGGA